MSARINYEFNQCYDVALALKHCHQSEIECELIENRMTKLVFFFVIELLSKHSSLKLN